MRLVSAARNYARSGIDYPAQRTAVAMEQVLQLLDYKPSYCRGEHCAPTRFTFPRPMSSAASRSIWAAASSTASSAKPAAISSISGDWLIDCRSTRRH